MNFAEIGTITGQIILSIANSILADYWPGLLSFSFFVVALMFGVLIWWVSGIRIKVLSNALASVQIASGSSGQALDLARIQEELSGERSAPGKRLANAFSEFRETLLETGRENELSVRNSIRPSAFLNPDDLGFSLKSWRFVPGLFVSFGLFFTFLGLVAVLSSTADILPNGSTTDQSDTMDALRVLLAKASAKFVISLSGLLCSILLNIWLQVRAGRIERHAERLANALERNMDFISLEALADRHLKATLEQTTNMQELNTRLIAELSEPLKKVSESSMENISDLVGQLGNSLTSGLGGSLDQVSQRIDEAGNSLQSVNASLKEASLQFDTTLKASMLSLGEAVEKLERTSEQLTAAAKIVGESTPALLETIKESNAHTLKIAEGSADMVNSAKSAISEEKEVVSEAMTTIQQLIRSFEDRASAYDGQLEKAFQVYQTEVAKTIDRLEAHGTGVQQRFADALSTLQAVIENAKAFEPESAQNKPLGGAAE